MPRRPPWRLKNSRLRELVEYVGHFVSAFAAADVDNDVNVRPFCQLVLYNGLTGAERTRYRSSTAFGDWEQGVDDTLTGNHWEVRGKLLGVRTLYADRPLLKHTYIVDRAVDGAGLENQ